MKTVLFDLPTFAFIVTTRAALAFGAGLLLAAKVPDDRRRALGLMLVAVGALTTIPAVRTVRANLGRADLPSAPRIGRDTRLMRSTRFPRKGDDDDNF